MKRGRPPKNEERLETRLGFRITQSMHDQMQRACQQRNITKSDFIIESLQQHLEKTHVSQTS